MPAFPNASSKSEPSANIARIESLLMEIGVSHIQKAFKDGRVTGLSFSVEAPTGKMSFDLPIDHERTLKAMKDHENTPWRLCNEKQAYRTAWRCTYEWIRAQVALILSGQVEPAEVFLAYVVDGQGQTLYRHLEEQGFAGYLAAPEQAERTAIVDMRKDA